MPQFFSPHLSLFPFPFFWPSTTPFFLNFPADHQQYYHQHPSPPSFIPSAFRSLFQPIPHFSFPFFQIYLSINQLHLLQTPPWPLTALSPSPTKHNPQLYSQLYLNETANQSPVKSHLSLANPRVLVPKRRRTLALWKATAHWSSKITRGCFPSAAWLVSSPLLKMRRVIT